MRTRKNFARMAFAVTAAALLALAQAPDTGPGLPLGSLAPDFSLADATGAKRSLAEFRGKKNVALVFYPALFRAGG